MVRLRWSLFWAVGVTVFIRKGLLEFQALILLLPAGLRKQLSLVGVHCTAQVL